MDNKLLEGENITPSNVAEARALIGCTVEVLHERDIDKSGRGYIFPSVRTVTGAFGRYIELDGDPKPINRVREMRLVSRLEATNGQE